MRKIWRRAKNHAALSERYTLSSLPDNNVGRVAAGDTYFAVRGGGGTLGVVRGGRVVGWIDVGRLHHLDAKAWMRHVGQPVRSTPARSPYAYMNPSRKAGRSPFDVNARLETDSGPPTRFSAKDMAAIRKAAVGVARRTTSMRSESRGSAVYAEPSVVRTSLGSVTVNAEYTSYGWRGVVYHKGVRDSFSIDADVALENPARKPIDHKFAGALFSAGHSKTALAYLRGTLTKSTARELAAGKKRR